jgi:hypothetical protein
LKHERLVLIRALAVPRDAPGAGRTGASGRSRSGRIPCSHGGRTFGRS